MSSSSKSKRSSSESEPAPVGGLTESLFWLIRLRWFAVAGIAAAAVLSRGFLSLDLPYHRILGVAAALGLYNSLLYLFLRSAGASGRRDLPVLSNRLVNVQIPLDLLALAALVHFSGGIENPFAFYFIFHIIIASVLLSRRASYLQAAIALLLFSGTAWLEYSGLLPHYCAAGTGSCLRAEGLHLAGVLAAFASTLFISAYMATSIAQRLREKEGSLRLANLQLLEKDKIKSNYVLRVTHDVKEHLAAIQACLDPVLAGVLGPVPATQESLIKRSYDRTGKLMVFVKALLEITRIKLSRRMETGRFSLKKTIESAVGHVEERAKAKKIDLNWSIGPGVDELHGSQIYIEETIANFLANSVKYTPEGGSVTLHAADAGASVLIRVRDTGMGIPSEDMPHLFTEFFRARNARAAEHTGTGLGLSIAKEVAERHNGRVWAESVEGKGSTFYFSLPKPQAASA